MFEQAVHSRRRCLDLEEMFLKVNCHIQDPYHQVYPPNTNVMLEVPKRFFAESVFDMDRPAGGSEAPKRLSWAKIRYADDAIDGLFLSTTQTVLDSCLETISTAKVCLLPPKYFKIFGCDASDFCLSKSLRSLLEVFAPKILAMTQTSMRARTFKKQHGDT